MVAGIEEVGPTKGAPGFDPEVMRRQSSGVTPLVEQVLSTPLPSGERPRQEPGRQHPVGGAGDQVSFNTEREQSIGSVPALHTWDEPSGTGVDNRNRGGTRDGTQALSASRAQHSQGQGQTPFGAMRNGRQGFPHGRNGKIGNSGNPADMLGRSPGNLASTNPATAATGMGGEARNGNSASPQVGDTEITVKKDESGRSRLRESGRGQREVREHSEREAELDVDAGRKLSESANQHGAAQQNFMQDSSLNTELGNQNMQLADQSNQAGQQANENGLVEQLMAMAQKKIQEMEKAREAQGKAVEQKGNGIRTQGQSIEQTGQGVETTGHTTEANGHATEGTGIGMQTSGEGLSAVGAALVGGLFTAPAGAALLAQGALLIGGGLGLQATGKGLQATGKGLQAQGQGLQSVGQQTQQVGEQTIQAGKSQQEQAKQKQEEAKQKESEHNELFKKLMEEAKKLFEQASQKVQEAGKNFQNADKSKEKAGDEGKKRDEAVDGASNANQRAVKHNEKADKARDNERAIDEAMKKAFGGNDQARESREDKENEPETDSSQNDVRRGTSEANSGSENASQAAASTGRRGDDTSVEIGRKHSPFMLAGQKRRGVERSGKSGHQGDSRREGEERRGRDERPVRESKSEERAGRGSASALPVMQGLVNSATPVSGTPTTATASATPLNGHASMGTGTLGGKPKYGAAAFGFGRNGENGSPIGSESRVHGLSGPAGSSDSSSQEGAGDKRVEPVSKKETKKGTATVDVADDNVTVRLNELSRSDDQPGASAGDSGREVKL